MVQLTQRERWLAAAGILLLVCGGVYGFILKPVVKRSQRLYEIIPRKQQELERIGNQGEQLVELETLVKQLHDRLPETDAEIAPLPHLESLLEIHDLKVSTMNKEPSVQEGDYTVTIIHIQLEEVSLAGLLRFLQDINDEETPLHVATIQLTRGAEDQGRLNVALTLNSVAVSS